MEPQSKLNSQAQIRQIREEIAKRKSALDAGKNDAKTHSPSKTPSKSTTAVSILTKASKALDKAKSRLQAAKKWPSFLRHIRCNNYAINQFLLESSRNLITEIKSLQKSIASLDSKYRHALHEHAIQIDALRAHEKQRVDTGSNPEQLQATIITLEAKFKELSEEQAGLKHSGFNPAQYQRLLTEFGTNQATLSSREDKRNLELRTRITYLEGVIHWIERGLVGNLQPLKPSENTALEDSAPLAEAEMQALRLDMFYLAFENQFRGSRELIKERLLQYLPVLEALKMRIPDATALDIGCGRGEWLEVLGGYNIEARGVDMNTRMAEQCRSRSLAVECGDGIAYLGNVPDNSLALVSGFHIVEHLELGQLLEMIRQAHRVLKPGGIAIFETPNPESLKVSSYTFFFDPTHRNPLPPELLSFMGSHSGFSDVRVERYQPYVEDGKMLGYLDYACIYTK